MGCAGEREEMTAAGVKKLLDRMRALNKVTYTRTLYCALSTPVMLSKFDATCFYGLLCEPQYACDCINWDSKKIDANLFSGPPDVASGTRAFPFGDLRAIEISDLESRFQLQTFADQSPRDSLACLLSPLNRHCW